MIQFMKIWIFTFSIMILFLISSMNDSYSIDYVDEEQTLSFRGAGIGPIDSDCENFTYQVNGSIKSDTPIPIKIEILDPNEKVIGIYEDSTHGAIDVLIKMNWDVGGKHLINFHYKDNVYLKDFAWHGKYPSNEQIADCLAAKSDNTDKEREEVYELIYPEEEDYNSLLKAATKFREINYFEEALELLEKAENFSDPPIVIEKYMVLAQMSRYQEALENFRELEDSSYNVFDFNEGILLYHLGKYSQASKVIAFAIIDIEENERSHTNRLIALGQATFSLGMILEKMGEQKLAEQAYTKTSEYLIIPNLDCTKVRFLISYGGYVEAMEILNNMDEEVMCKEDSVKSLKNLVQERINKYVSPPSILKSSEIKCGKGTIENEYGQCVLVSQTKGGGCLIATATFGSELAPQVQMLREIRDNSLLQTQSGQSFMQGFNQFYYSFSPTIADYERQNPVFKETVKIVITPLLASLSLLNYVDLDSEESVLGYGIGIIILNIGMYFMTPVIVIHKIKWRIKLFT